MRPSHQCDWDAFFFKASFVSPLNSGGRTCVFALTFVAILK
jgi:hypothetical protein